MDKSSRVTNRELERWMRYDRDVKQRKLYCAERNIDRFFKRQKPIINRLPDIMADDMRDGRMGRWK